jgi:hypothetical protein
MPPNDTRENKGWTRAQRNPTYLRGALDEAEGQRIRWHSPEAPASSQVFCISAFGKLRSLPDGSAILNRLFAETVPNTPPANQWDLSIEYVEEGVLGETGMGTPTNIDVYCVSTGAVVCIESKFLYDANEGFGRCGQFIAGECAGYRGFGSDRRTKRMDSLCRLEAQEGRRDPRKYWQLARAYFQEAVFREQRAGDTCPFAMSNYQLMRNFLFAATKAGAGQEFGVVAMVPERTASKVRTQVATFHKNVLSEPYRAHINVGTYDALAAHLLQSPHQASIAHGEFLRERMTTLL